MKTNIQAALAIVLLALITFTGVRLQVYNTTTAFVVFGLVLMGGYLIAKVLKDQYRP